MDLINLKILSHPLNWLIVWIVLILASFLYREAHTLIATPSAPIPD